MVGLKEQIAAYEALRSDLELEHFGEWVVFHDEKLVGAYETFEAAADAAIRRFGRGPYLIRRVGAGPLTLPPYVQYRSAHADG